MDSNSFIISSDDVELPQDVEGQESYSSYSSTYSVSPYVPWDVSYLDKFYSHIKSSIGSSVNIGVQIFAIIMGIVLVISVVRRFIR